MLPLWRVGKSSSLHFHEADSLSTPAAYGRDTRWRRLSFNLEETNLVLIYSEAWIFEGMFRLLREVLEGGADRKNV